jgi:hypothetical protein
MLTGVSSKWKVFETYVLRYTRLLVETSPKFPIYFPKVYTIRNGERLLNTSGGPDELQQTIQGEGENVASDDGR